MLHDRNGSFAPQFVEKYQATLSDEAEKMSFACLCHRQNYQDIRREIEKQYTFCTSIEIIIAMTVIVPKLER